MQNLLVERGNASLLFIFKYNFEVLWTTACNQKPPYIPKLNGLVLRCHQLKIEI
jgi:hypothetical protein